MTQGGGPYQWLVVDDTIDRADNLLYCACVCAVVGGFIISEIMSKHIGLSTVVCNMLPQELCWITVVTAACTTYGIKQ